MMKYPPATTAIPISAAAAAIVAIGLWLWGGDIGNLSPRQPQPVQSAAQNLPPARFPLPGDLAKGAAAAGDFGGAWPRFRGANLDNISADDTPLMRQMPPEGPRQIWSIDLGEGYAGAAVLAGRVYVLDYDQNEKADVLRCLSQADGGEIWRRWYSVLIKRQHGMSRTIPAVTEQHVVTIGPKCHVLCCNAADGEAKWSIDMVRRYGATVPPWYTGQCPLIDNGRAILAPAGPDVLMIAVDCESGKVLWETPNPHGWKMSHSSIVPVEFAGRRIYVYCASGGVAGVDAENGDILWATDAWRISMATVPSPVPVGDGRIFLAGGYGAGSMMLQMRQADGKITVRALYTLQPRVFDAEQQTPVFYRGFLYAVRTDGKLACMDPNGRLCWTSGTDRFGLGPYLIADGMILIMNDSGVLSLVEATPETYRPLSRAKVLTGHESWGPMALAGGRLIVRDLTRMVCLDMRKNQRP